MITEAPTASNLLELLRECAAAAPREMRDPRSGWGFSAAGKLLGEARSQGLGAAADEALRTMLTSGDADEVYLALTLTPPDVLSPADVVAVDVAALYPEAQEQHRVVVGTLVSAGRLAYDPAMRAERAKAGGRAFVAAYIAYDHAWFWQNATTALAPTLGAAATALGLALGKLSRAEVELLRAEVAANTPGLPADWAQAFGEDIEAYIQKGTRFADDVAAPRFSPL